MDKKVVSLAKKSGSGKLRTPKEALEEALNYIDQEGAFKAGKKLLIICLDEGIKTDEYHVSWVQAGMKMSQCVTLCEVAKMSLLEEMGYCTTDTSTRGR